MNASLKSDYQICKQISLSSKATFPKAFWLLPQSQRRALYSIYAYFRLLDDIVDGPSDKKQKELQLNELVFQFQRSKQHPSQHAVLRALQNTIQQFSLLETPFLKMVEGLKIDLYSVPILDEQDLWHYCDCVAGTVGLLLVQIAGVPFEDGAEYALYTGRALQLTNILRDVRNDAHQNRIYIPRSMLQKHGLEPVMLQSEPYPTAVKDVLYEIAEMIQTLFEQSKHAKPARYTYELRFTETLRWMYQELFQELVNVEFEVHKLKKRNKLVLYFQLLKHYSIQ
ncbi:MAG: squalene/phytoene synthase family protein [bacterium]|nr:squalene/phytoene synthase family protein [bacterium]